MWDLALNFQAFLLSLKSNINISNILKNVLRRHLEKMII